MHRFKLFLIALMMLIAMASCGSCSFTDYTEEGEAAVRSLIQELKTIRSREQLLDRSGKIKWSFDRLVDIMIAAEEYCDAHPEFERTEFVKPNHELSDQLREELNRLYQLEGGRQVIEKSQEKALHRLDAFLKHRSKTLR